MTRKKAPERGAFRFDLGVNPDCLIVVLLLIVIVVPHLVVVIASLLVLVVSCRILSSSSWRFLSSSSRRILSSSSCRILSSSSANTAGAATASVAVANAPIIKSVWRRVRCLVSGKRSYIFSFFPPIEANEREDQAFPSQRTPQAWMISRSRSTDCSSICWRSKLRSAGSSCSMRSLHSFQRTRQSPKSLVAAHQLVQGLIAKLQK